VNNCCCGTVTTPVQAALYRAIQGLSFVVQCVVEIMGAAAAQGHREGGSGTPPWKFSALS